jgi:hypothetical protein
MPTESCLNLDVLLKRQDRTFPEEKFICILRMGSFIFIVLLKSDSV